MPKAPPPPSSRGFTVAEKRSITFERIALGVALGVGLVAATISFIALTWVGTHMRMPGWVAPLVPLAIDGFGIACSVGIVRSTSEGKPWRDRASEWVGLFVALGLSVAGNVAHVLDTTPAWLLVTFAVAVPTIVAYSVHVYGRAMVQGLSARIMADEPDKLQYEVPTHAASAPTSARAAARPTPAPQASTRAERKLLDRNPPRMDATAATRSGATADPTSVSVPAARAEPRESIARPSASAAARTQAGVLARASSGAGDAADWFDTVRAITVEMTKADKANKKPDAKLVHATAVQRLRLSEAPRSEPNTRTKVREFHAEWMAQGDTEQDDAVGGRADVVQLPVSASR